MVKRKHKPNRKLNRHRTKATTSRSRAKQTTKKTENQETGRDGERSISSEPQKSQAEWVKVEHRDADGNPMLPKELIAGTYNRRYGDVPHGTEIQVLVLAGYKPKALMLVERKIYEIHRLNVQGWRRIGQIVVEIEGWRDYEGDWFKAMRGVRLQIKDPGFPSSNNEDSNYVVSESSIDRKIVTLVSEKGNKSEMKLFEGTLDISETWKSAWQRQSAEVLNLGFKNLLLPLLAAVVAGLVVWWIARTPIPTGHDLEKRGNTVAIDLQERINDSASESSKESVIQSSTYVPKKQTAHEEQDPTNSVPKDGSDKERVTHDDAEELNRRPTTSFGAEGQDSELRKSAATVPVEMRKSEVSGND